MEAKKRVLVVGAGGFAGGFIVDAGIERGYEVWAGVRASTSRKYLSDKRITFLELDFENPESLAKSLSQALPEGERWHYIVYNLGATKCLNFRDFNRINYEYLQSFTGALHAADKVPDKMLYMSSLSAMGPGDEKGYAPIKATDIPRPNTRYGASKLKAEMWLLTAGIPTIVFRCTGIYGPRDKDYFLMFESIAKGVDFGVGYKKQCLSFIYVADLAQAIFDALERSATGTTYLISEPRGYTQKEFRAIAAQAIGRKHVVPMRLPLWMVKTASAVAEKWGLIRMKPSTLNRDKFNILKQRNWLADVSAAEEGFGFNAPTSLREGVENSVEWYKKEGWLK